jgi:transposase
MGKGNFTDEFKRVGVRQITVRGSPVSAVSQRLGVRAISLYVWRKMSASEVSMGGVRAVEIRQLKRERARVTEERDILKKAAAYFAKDAK